MLDPEHDPSSMSVGTDSYVVGAYPASPAHREWHPDRECEFFDRLQSLENISALELPWLGSLHPHDDEWLLQNYPPRLSAVVTDIGYVMSTVGDGRAFGLASTDVAGRQAALVDVERLRSDVRRFNDRAGRLVVTAVEFHSAPRTLSDAEALAASLADISDRDWDGAQLLIEHCDAAVPEHEPQKGFLALDDEIAAIQHSEVSVGLSLNWGRSATEFRDPDRVTEHIRTASSSGLLHGLIFSGASDRDGDAGGAWTDAHHAFAASPGHPSGDPTSLLTDARVEDALAAAVSEGTENAPKWLGVKVGWARPSGSVAERVRMIRDALAATDLRWNSALRESRSDTP
ncbi:DUF4862 family protein [Paramicrobacterium chengjingii]|uniref:DUF4862 family protein n=1 Tax=Paramicrobacterium chengjingii TaxID=2769067 RepID=UPI001424A1B9|nr:DUF4862 family protein [Microbacterium chengjingii]